MVERKHWDEVRSRERYIIKEIDPIKLLPALERGDEPVLDQRDREAITAAYNNYGPSHATQTELLMRLKKRGPLAFSMFVAALRETGQGHAAQLLDPEFKVTAIICNGMRDDRVFAAGVVADIRVKVCLRDLTDEQKKEVERFCERYKTSSSDDTVELRQHFTDLLNENIRQFVNLVKTISSDEVPLILIFRFSNVEAAKAFWEDFTNGNLKSTIKTKLQSFPDENNCFRNGEISCDLVVDPDDYKKVYDTLQNREECKVLVDGMERQELRLRDYQLDLVQPALEGKNTIICAPTGSGKTFVAMEAIKHHVMSPNTGPNRKFIAFIVNTVSLVEQQLSCLERYLPESVEVSSVCGSNPDISLPSVLEYSEVVVLTAQVLLNALKKEKEASSPEQDEAEEKHISISQFSLLVFDECHHTTKEHPYNEIMRWYMKEKFSEEPSPDLPQIIGLSASLGIGTGNNGCGTKAKQNIIQLCANLDVHELQVYTEPQITCTKITPISRDRSNVFHTTISDVMTEIEKISSFDKPSYPHGSQPYENWVVNLSKEDLGRDKLTCAEQLKFYNDSLMINGEVRSEDALRYLQENICIRSEKSTEFELKLHEIFEKAVAGLGACSEPNPGLQKLEELLLEKLSCCDNGLQSKGIVFVRTRFVAGALVNWLENCPSLKNLVKNPTSVIGCGQRNGKVGMPKARQDHEIKSFRDGNCNVVVATSALLEGIDVQKCNFAINYGMPGNEITHVQARGRVRANGNEPCDYTYDIVVPREQLILKERDLAKEQLMKESIEKVKEMSRKDFEEKLECLQKKAYKEYLNNLAKQASNQAQSVPDDVDFLCSKCGAFACKAKHIKKYHTAYIVPNYEVNLQNVRFEDNTSTKYFAGDFNKTGKTHCNTCGKDWGNRARNNYGEFPLLKITGFRVKSRSRTTVYKKWSEFPYELERFDPDDDITTD